jgi:hypothetical protein
MNTFRYYNLSKMALGAYNGLGISWDVKATVDLLHTSLSDYGNITAGGDNFPHYGAGIHHGALLSNTYSFGSLTSQNTAAFDFGAIA